MRIVDEPSGEALERGPQSSEERALVGLLLTIGALPWLGFALLGHWSDRELGVGLLVLLVATRELFATWAKSRIHPPVSSRTVWRNRWISHTWR